MQISQILKSQFTDAIWDVAADRGFSWPFTLTLDGWPLKGNILECSPSPRGFVHVAGRRCHTFKRLNLDS